MPLIALIAAQMVTRSMSAGVDLLYPARVPIVLLASLAFGSIVAAGRPSFSWFAVVAGVAVYAGWTLLDSLSPSTDSALRNSLASWPTWRSGTWLTIRVIGSVLVVPFAEELAFRGYLIRRLISADFESVPPGKLTAWSLLISSALFGLLHGRWFAAFAAGIVYAFVYNRRGRVCDAVMAHAVTNALIAAEVLVFGHWYLWA